MKIRKATLRDIPALRVLHHELDRYHAKLMPAIFQTLARDPRPDTYYHDWIRHPENGCCLVAEEDGRVIGFLTVRQSSPPHFPVYRSGDFAVIEDAAVKEAERGRGVGSQLLDAAAAWATARGLPQIQLMVWSDNRAAAEFYRRRGFRPLLQKLALDLPPPPDPPPPR